MLRVIKEQVPVPAWLLMIMLFAVGFETVAKVARYYERQQYEAEMTACIKKAPLPCKIKGVTVIIRKAKQ